MLANLTVLVQQKFPIILTNCSSFFLLPLYLPKLKSVIRGKNHMKLLPIIPGTDTLFGHINYFYLFSFSKKI